MSIGERIASLRKSRGWTQARLAEEAQISPSAIAMYETNRRTPDSSALSRLASAFGVEPESLASPHAFTASTGAPHTHAAPSAHQADGLTTLTLTRDEARVILLLRMNPKVRAFLESYLAADEQTRAQMEKTWRLIQDFHP